MFTGWLLKKTGAAMAQGATFERWEVMSTQRTDLDFILREAVPKRSLTTLTCADSTGRSSSVASAVFVMGNLSASWGQHGSQTSASHGWGQR